MRFNHQFTDSLLVRGVAAAKANETRSAKQYFERVLHLPATQYQRQKALYWLSETVEDPAEVREYLEEILIVNPGHQLARRKLAILDGRLKENEIVDPNQYEAEVPVEPQDTKGERFVCPNCGGRMVYTPQGNQLICEYCRYTPQLQSDESPVSEQDFIVGMATAKGHSLAISTKAFTCEACGAAYLISSETLSLTCAHCDSSYAIESIEERELIPPEGIIPFATTRDQAEKKLMAEVIEEGTKLRAKLETLQGVYLPVWTFDVHGEVPYTHIEHNGGQLTDATKSVSFDDLLVPASKPLPRGIWDILPSYRLEDIEPFKPKYLSNWLAETYQTKLSDAALEARSMAVKRTKQSIKNDAVHKLSGLEIKSAYLYIHSYKLILLPVWIGQYHLGKQQYEVMINGQTNEFLIGSIVEA